MKTKLTLLLILIAPLVARPADELSAALQKGLFEEEANQNLPAAIKAYESLLAASDEQRKLAATALFRLGECYRKLGRTNDAVAQYQRLLRDFADQTTLATLSRQNLTGLGTESGAAAGSIVRSAVAGVDPAASAEGIRAEVLLERLKQMPRDEVLKVMPTIAPDALLNSLLEQRAERQRVFAAGRVNFSDDHPSTKSARAGLKVIEEQIDERIEGILKGLEIKASALKQQAAEAGDSAGRGGGAFVPVNQEEQEIHRIQALIKDSPDLINAVNVEIAKVRSGELMVPKNGTLLHKAASLGQLGVAKFLLENGADVGVRDEMGRTPLHRAAGNGHKAMVELLLVNKADANARVSQYPDNGSSPLHLAADKGYRTVCEALLARGADPNLGDASVSPPIYSAVWANDEATLRLLLAKGAKANPEPGKKGYTPLHNASTTNIARILIEAGAVVDALNNDNQSPLHLKASAGNREVVEVLLGAGANPNLKDKDGKTPLHLAAANWRASVVAPLIAKGAKPNERNAYGGVPLDEVIRFDDSRGRDSSHAPQLETLQAFLAGGADPNLTSVGGVPHLFKAVAEGLEEAVEALLKAGANPNAKSDQVDANTYSKGETPLIKALRGTRRTDRYTSVRDRPRSMSLVNLLLEYKADVNLPNGNGDTPLYHAIVSGSQGFAEKVPFVEALLKHGANIEGRISSSDTPLSIAASGRMKEMVELLLKHKADPNAKTGNGKSPLHLAAVNRSMELVDILLAAGADANALDAQGLSALDYVKGTSSPPPPGGFGLPLPPPLAPPPYIPGQQSSQRKETSPTELAERLRKAGARDWAPRPGLITVTRRSTGASQVTFSKGTNDWNRHSLLELMGYTYFGSDTKFPFPDLSKVTITRADSSATGGIKEFTVDLPAALAKDGCKADQWLEWGDLIDIPEGEHKLGERWKGQVGVDIEAVNKCVARTVTVTVKGKSKDMLRAAGIWRSTHGANGVITFYPDQPFTLRDTVLNSGLLLTSSDMTRVKVTRSDAVGGMKEWTFDLSKEPSAGNDLWLRDGDRIEVPEK